MATRLYTHIHDPLVGPMEVQVCKVSDDSVIATYAYEYKELAEYIVRIANDDSVVKL